MEILLALLGILFTILLSGPALRGVSRFYRDRRARRGWSADLQVEKEVISSVEDYAWEFWTETIKVDHLGNAVHEIDARIVNLKNTLLAEVRFPIYCDGLGALADTLAPWARFGRQPLTAEVGDWDSAKCRGRIYIRFEPPLAPKQRKRLRWGFSLPATFAPGDEYYSWDIATPHFEIRGSLDFDPVWRVLYARWKGEVGTSQQAPRVDGSRIEAIFRFPPRGGRITLELGLARSG